MRILRVKDRLELDRQEDGSSRLILASLCPGREICLGTLNPIKKLIFEFARGMQNIIYIVGDRRSKECLLVDVCWDAEGVMAEMERRGLYPVGCIVTHNHFDHYGGKPPPPFGSFGISVQGVKTVLSKYPTIPVYIHQADADAFQTESTIDPARIRTTTDNQTFWLGGNEEGIKLRFIHTPGHTPGAQCVMIDERRLLTGDTLFVGSSGRMDLPGGCPVIMFNTLQNILAVLPEETRIYPGHSYGGMLMSTVGEGEEIGCSTTGNFGGMASYGDSPW